MFDGRHIMSLNTMLELLDSTSPQCEQLCRQEHINTVHQTKTACARLL